MMKESICDFSVSDDIDFDFLETNRHIGRWGVMRRAYLKQTNPEYLQELIFSGKLRNHLNHLNEMADYRYCSLIQKMKEKEGLSDDLKYISQKEWIQAMKRIVSQAEEIVKQEYVYF